MTYLTYYFLLSLSMIGYGFFISRILKINYVNIGFLGLLGISTLIFISYATTLFIVHNFYFNISILILGIFFFSINFKNIEKNDLKLFAVVFFILLLFILAAKNHDDFPYYHFPYSHFLTQLEHPIGFGKLNPGFRNPSSVFFLSSLFYLPYIDHYLLNLYPVYFLGFSNIILLKFIFNKKDFNDHKSTNILSLLCFSFINIFFYRMAEHGTDRSGMIIIFIMLVVLFLIIFRKKNKIDKFYENKNYFKILSIFSVVLMSLKPLYIIYLPLILVLFTLKEFRLNFNNLIFTRSTIYSASILIFVFFFTWLNSGCLIFPADITCFYNLPWSFSEKVIIETNRWYEVWSKAGATPNYTVDNFDFYIKNLNWFPNWIDNYFFNKMSDFLLGLFVLVIIFYFTFIFKQSLTLKKNKILNLQYILIYIFLIICLIEWFFKHPSLRYGGYQIFALLVFLPISIKFSLINIDYKKYYKKALFLAVLTIIIFSYRNIDRLIKEYQIYNFNPFVSTNYMYDEKQHNRILRHMNKTVSKFKTINIFGAKFIICVPK